ncbi:MAG: cobalt/nickel transport system permease protein [Tepidanaerobacteraceae bacterium]|nr:cobalt/nickel transport system permease protein [Tepidanaerobacteraceae bacterium]
MEFYPEEKDYFFKKTDGRVKLVSAIFSIAALSTIRTWEYLAACLGFYIFLLCLTGFPVLKWMRRIFFPVLFAGAMSAAAAFANFYAGRQYAGIDGAVLFLRALCAIVVLSSVIYSMSFRELVFSLKVLHVPDVLVNLIGFTIRYANILTDELSRMKKARKARGYSKGRNFWHTATMKVIGQTVAVLFLRSYERSERVYQAMLSRGYGGDIRLLSAPARPGKKDFAFGALMAGVPLFFKVAEMGAFSWIMR